MMKTVIIGGVAGGASCAARLRRLNEDMEIIILEKGDYISFANCGLPYHVGGVIESKNALLLQSPEMMRSRFNIEVRTNNEVTEINKKDKYVTVLDKNRQPYQETYDYLVIATGSSPVRPNIPGIDDPRIRTIWNVNDASAIRALVNDEDIQHVCIIGAGFIGLEMTENIVNAGKKVSLIEGTPQVMNNIDYEMSLLVKKALLDKGVDLRLNSRVTGFEEEKEHIIIKLSDAESLKADLVIMAIGVRPNSSLAEKAGLTLNSRGGIVVDEYLCTCDPCIYAAGDVIEVEDLITAEKTMIPLAGPANKQGRMVADNISGHHQKYRGTQGTFIARIFNLTVAATGLKEADLKARGLVRGKDYEVVAISANNHAMYYPGARPMMFKVLYDVHSLQILGTQIIGEEGTDKRIDVLATAMRLKARITDLKELELAYAPPYSSAKDPVNMVGYTAENVINGLEYFAGYDEIENNPEAICLDVRELREVQAFAIPNAIHIPLGTLRDNLDKLDPEKTIIVMCAAGVRAHTASRILQQHGFHNVKVYPGGARFYRLTH